MAEAFEYIKLRLTAEIGGHFFDDIVSASATFGLNSIPTAQLVVAVGKDYSRDANGKPATIHLVRHLLRPRDKVFVWLTVETTQSPSVVVAKYKIFEGYLSGIGYQRSHNQANFVIGVVHWLDDLSNSSAATGNWTPGAAYDLAQCALYNELNKKGTNVAGVPVPILDANYEVVNMRNVQSDLWLNTIRPIYIKMAEWAHAAQQNIPANGGGEGTNNAAIGDAQDGALYRMPGSGIDYYEPVGLNLGQPENATELANSIRAALQISNTNCFAYTTFWNKLIGESAPQFFFAVSPAIDWAFPIPFFGGLRRPWRTIKADDYTYANFNANMTQLLESVDIFYPVGSMRMNASGGLGSPFNAAGMAAPLGSFPEDDKQNKRGLKLYKETPTWLNNTVVDHGNAPDTSGLASGANGDTMTPDNGKRVPTMNSASVMLHTLKDSKIADKLAKHWFQTEYLQQRFGELSGKLRFDIAPGSTIRIETPPRDVSVYEDTNHYMYANVVQVSYVINAERSTAGTAFTLSNIRTEAENEDDTITSTEPPLFNNTWLGGPLAVPE